MNLKDARFRLLRLQLTGLFVLLSLVVLGAYVMFRHQLYSQLERELRLMGKAVVFSVEHRPNGEPDFEESIYLANRPDRINLGLQASAQWLDLAGRITHSSGKLEIAPHPSQDEEFHYQAMPPAMVYTQLATWNGKPFGYARVARGLAPLREQLNLLLAGLLSLGGCTLLLTGLAGWWWTGRTLAPLREAYQELLIFSGAVSHELRSPLTAIRTNCQSLLRHLDQLSPAELRESLGELDDASADMANLVNDLILLAQADHEPQEVGPLKLQPLMESVSLSLQPLASKRNLEILVPSCDLQVLAYEPYLRLVVRNLLENAIHYSPTGGRVEILCQTVDGLAELAIRDHGVGMNKEEIRQAFQPFWRADASRSRHSGGAGLGLAIVDSLVSHQGGGILVESQPGQGSTFRVRLPLA